MLCLVAQLCSTLCDPMDCSPPGSSVHGILQTRILEWVAIPFSQGSSRPRNWKRVSCIAGRFFKVWATREAPIQNKKIKKRKLKYVLYIIANKLQPHFWRGGGDWMHEGCSGVRVTFYFLIWIVWLCKTSMAYTLMDTN